MILGLVEGAWGVLYEIKNKVGAKRRVKKMIYKIELKMVYYTANYRNKIGLLLGIALRTRKKYQSHGIICEKALCF